MINSANVPDVQASEMLARYVLYSRDVRSSDQTVKPGAFVPHPYLELSVTRHREASEPEIWNAGEEVARGQARTLHGRADVQAQACLSEELRVVKDPVAGNPNHANVTGWPSERPRQKMIATLLAAAARYVSNPNLRQPPR